MATHLLSKAIPTSERKLDLCIGGPRISVSMVYLRTRTNGTHALRPYTDACVDMIHMHVSAVDANVCEHFSHVCERFIHV